MTTPQIEGWKVSPDHHSTFVRGFMLSPVENLDIDYKTFEKYKGRLIDATYTARVSWVYVRHQWDEDKQAWWGQASRSLRLIDPKTNEPYTKGWRAEQQLRQDGSDLKNDEVTELLLAATHPGTIISVFEEPDFATAAGATS